ncbi:MAG TPA: AAA family ATPase [Candidatus Binatia bacterium]
MYEKYFGFVELPFSVSPDPRFFYSNPVYREALVTLRYGIEARKGFVIITGEAGTGKTTLLRMVGHNLDSAIHTAFIFNPRLSFTALLRFILSDLGVASSAKDRLKLTEQLNGHLTEQLRKGQTVALLVDEAQALSDELLEELRLLSNLETDREKLIQIVLIGQPELEHKLDEPDLRQLKQRVTLRCRLLPLSQHEVGLYIASRLKTAGYEGQELFVPEAVRKITRYSNGIPRLVNVICDNALVIAFAASKKQVSAEMIEEAARDLKLTGQPQVQAEAATTDAALGEDFKRTFRPAPHAVDEPWRLDFEPIRAGAHIERRSRSFAALGIGVLLGMAISAGIALYAQQTGSLAVLDANFKNLANVDIKDLAGLRRENPERTGSGLNTEVLKKTPPYPPEPNTEVLKEIPPVKTPDPLVPESRESEPPAPKPNQNSLALPEIKKPDTPAIPEAATPSQITKSKETPPTPTKTITKDRPLRAPDNVAPTAEQLEFEIYKAIYSRAIKGVEVSVRDGTAYLAGQVATENQKIAAAQAASRVAGVREVRDEIVVNLPGDPSKAQ